MPVFVLDSCRCPSSMSTLINLVTAVVAPFSRVIVALPVTPLLELQLPPSRLPPLDLPYLTATLHLYCSLPPPASTGRYHCPASTAALLLSAGTTALAGRCCWWVHFTTYFRHVKCATWHSYHAPSSLYYAIYACLQILFHFQWVLHNY
jgi:hypothetical protein